MLSRSPLCRKRRARLLLDAAGLLNVFVHLPARQGIIGRKLDYLLRIYHMPPRRVPFLPRAWRTPLQAALGEDCL